VEIEGRFYCKEHVSVIIDGIRKGTNVHAKITGSSGAMDSRHRGVTINNSVSAVSKATVIEKHRVGFFHGLVRFFALMGMLGFSLIGLVGVLDWHYEVITVAGFAFAFFFVVFLFDIIYCNNRG
jgi:hypothetical protein